MASRPELPRAVLFDVGNTILQERRFDLEAGIGAVVTDGERARALADAFRAQTVERHERTEEVLLARWLVDHAPSLASESLDAIEDRIWAAVVTLTPMPGVDGVFARLSTDGIPIAALSNAAFSGRVLRAELARHGMGDHLRFVISSADVGVRKPAVAIFEAAVERLGVAARQTWFVGDTMEEDIAGAIAAGLQPILFGRTATARPSGWAVPAVGDWTEFATLYASARMRPGDVLPAAARPNPA